MLVPRSTKGTTGQSYFNSSFQRFWLIYHILSYKTRIWAILEEIFKIRIGVSNFYLYLVVIHDSIFVLEFNWWIKVREIRDFSKNVFKWNMMIWRSIWGRNWMKLVLLNSYLNRCSEFLSFFELQDAGPGLTFWVDFCIIKWRS